MKVELELKNGKRRNFHPAVAKVLVAQGMGKAITDAPQTYQTRMMIAETFSAASGPTQGFKYESTDPVDELEALKAEADKRGIKYHHRAGPAKLRELLGS